MEKSDYIMVMALALFSPFIAAGYGLVQLYRFVELHAIFKGDERAREKLYSRYR